MFNKNRFSYLILINITILLGILSRNIGNIPLYFGDILYAIMVYFGMCFLFINSNQKRLFFYALLFCFCIEFQQIYRADWIIYIRRTVIGRYIFGQDFIWSDLAYYLVGLILASSFNSLTMKSK